MQAAANIAGIAREAVGAASEEVAGAARGAAKPFIQAVGISTSEDAPPGRGLGSPAETRQARKPTALSAISTGARRLGPQEGMGKASLAFASSILHTASLPLFIAGVMMVLMGIEDLNGYQAKAGVALITLAYALWFSRSVTRMLHAHRKKDQIIMRPAGPTERSGDIGGLLPSLRTTAHVLEIIAATGMLLGGISWFIVRDKLNAVTPYALWLLGSLAYVCQHYIEGRLVSTLYQSTFFLPGHSQRERAFAEDLANIGFLIASCFLLAGSVNLNCAYWKAGLLWWLISGVVLVGPAVGDIVSSTITRKLQYNEAANVVAAQAALDVQEAPSTGVLAEVMDKLLVTGETYEEAHDGQDIYNSLHSLEKQLRRRVAPILE